MKKLKVVMLGPSLEEKGGMGSVATLILKTAKAKVQIQHICTWDGESSKRPKLHMLKVFFKAFVTLLWKLLLNQVDLVHLHLAERGSALRKSILALTSLAFGKPVIMHAHGSEFHLFYAQLPHELQFLLNWVFQKCTYLIVLSESWKDFYIKNCGLREEQVIVLANPVELPGEIPKRTHTERLNFVFLGKINQRKGVFDLIEAFAHLNTECKQRSQLTLAGTGDVERASNLAQALKIGPKVQFTGWIDSCQRNTLLAEADVFLLPSYNEGLPMALLEAMSWGLPAITTPVGGISEVITHQKDGWLIDPGNVGQLTEAMQSLIENESLRKDLGIAARMRVAPLDINKYTRSLIDIYYSAVNLCKN